MYKFCIFAGTTEGRKLVEFLSAQSVSVTACVATEYGEALLKASDNLTVSAQRLTRNEMVGLFSKQRYDLVLDATHPYATDVTENIEYACKTTNTEYLRLLREDSTLPSDTVFCDISSAVEFLNTTEGNILLTTGSKDIAKYTGIRDFAERVYARVLPTESSLEACHAVGLKAAHIIAMQGSFSEEMNTATLECVSAKYLVTKDGGEAGGFDAKAAAAERAGARLVVIGRPVQREGLSYSQIINILCTRFECALKPYVTIVGIGPGNQEAMTGEVFWAIKRADCLIGAKRMLETVNVERQSVYDAISPDKIADFIKTNPQYRRFTVLMSGDVGFFSGTKKLVPLLDDCEVNVLPGLSSLSYLCAKLKTSYEDVATFSLHGRECDIVSKVLANSRVFVLVGGECGVHDLCAALLNADLGHVKMHIGERLSYPNEKITTGTVEELYCGNYDKLSVVLIENERWNTLVTHGLRDDEFLRECGANSVPMTKSEVRTVCLSKLRLTERAICWDVGAGTGSVAVEMARCARKGQVYAIEKKETAIELLERNKNKFSLENMTVVEGNAPEICSELPTPTHAFIGGSSGNMKGVIAQLLGKNPAVRIVATAISLETVAELNTCMKEFAFSETEVVSMNISRAKEIGKYHLMTAQNPVYIFTMQNGEKSK